MSYITNETAHTAILDELRHSLSDIVQEADGVTQEVNRAQDLRCLAHQLLKMENTAL